MKAVSKAQQRKNRELLADFLDNDMNDKQFNMGTWARPADNPCGTVGCALGWAAMSGMIPGLGWNYNPDDMHKRPAYRDIVPIVGGKVQDWDDVGAAFFGETTHHNVFIGDPVDNNQDPLRSGRRVIAAMLRTVKD